MQRDYRLKGSLVDLAFYMTLVSGQLSPLDRHQHSRTRCRQVTPKF